MEVSCSVNIQLFVELVHSPEEVARELRLLCWQKILQIDQKYEFKTNLDTTHPSDAIWTTRTTTIKSRSTASARLSAYASWLQTHRQNPRTGNDHSLLQCEGNCPLLHSASRAPNIDRYALETRTWHLTLTSTFDLDTHTNGRTDGRTDGTNYIISLASRSIKIRTRNRYIIEKPPPPPTYERDLIFFNSIFGSIFMEHVKLASCQWGLPMGWVYWPKCMLHIWFRIWKSVEAAGQMVLPLLALETCTNP